MVVSYTKMGMCLFIIILMSYRYECTIPHCTQTTIDSKGEEVCKECEDSYYVNSGVCSACSSGCRKCDYNYCSTCSDGYFKSSYLFTIYCSPCLNNCKKCDYRYFCDECKDGYTLKKHNVFNSKDECLQGITMPR